MGATSSREKQEKESGVVELRLRGVVEGFGEGILLVIDDYISFLGDLDPKKGVLRKKGYEDIEVRDKILVFRGSRGSTVGTYVIYSISKAGLAPRAMIVDKADQVVITGCVVGNIALGETLGFRVKDLANYNGRHAMVKIRGNEGVLEIHSS
ncbi:universally conserved protein [Desulfurococcaceae archaeon AG1]|jgi:predicted aconitase with swiveling domain|nr:universally conserved protein [Desulfurococcaceae archaeon AG1]